MYTPKNRITIIEDDNRVIIDGRVVSVNLSSLDDDIWAVQWNVQSKVGEIEYDSNKLNEKITSIYDFKAIINKACVIIQANIDAELVEEEARAALENTIDYQEELKATEIKTTANNIVNAQLEKYPSAELLSFDKQEQQAKIYLADNTASIPFIEGLANARGVTILEQVEKIVMKSQFFEGFTSAVFGQRQKFMDELKTMVEGGSASADDIKNYSFEYEVD